jgi:hypothetical protein
MTDPVLFGDSDSWKNTMPDIPIVEDDENWIGTTYRELEGGSEGGVTYPSKTHRRRGSSFPRALFFAPIIVALVATGTGFIGYASHHPAKSPPVTTATTILRPRPTVTRTETRRVPGPTVTERLRSKVTVRATRTVPGPRVTVTACPPAMTCVPTADGAPSNG